MDENTEKWIDDWSIGLVAVYIAKKIQGDISFRMDNFGILFKGDFDTEN